MFNTVKRLLMPAALALGLVPAGAGAALITLTTADGDGADSFVRGGPGIDPGSGIAFRNTNYGASILSALKFNRSGIGGGGNTIDYENSFTRAAYFRFDIGSIGGTVTAATLSLGIRATELGNPVGIVFNAIADGHAQDGAPGAGGWEENALTMANSGLLTDPAGLIQPISNFTVPGTPGPAVGPILNWSHSNLVSQLNDDTNGLVTFVLIGAPVVSGRGANFWTKENLEGALFPTLSLTVEPDQVAVNAPGALSLLGLGLAFVAVGRRRRKDGGAKTGAASCAPQPAAKS
jgi:hypothetical protein